MNHNNNKKFFQKKGNDNHNFGFLYSRQSHKNKGLSDSIEDGEIISSKQSISPDKLKATPNRQKFQNLDPESQENNRDFNYQNIKSRMGTDLQFQNQNTGNDINYNQNERQNFAQIEKFEQIDNDSQSQQSFQKSNENEPEPESMENQEQSQADVFNHNYMIRNFQNQQNIDQLSGEFNRQNRGSNSRQTYQIHQDNEYVQSRYNKHEQKDVLNIKQQNYELSGEEAEMAEMQDDEGAENIGGERKSINQRNIHNQQDREELWILNNRDINLDMSEENEPDVQSGLLQQYGDEDGISIQDKSESQIYGQTENNQESSFVATDDKQQFQEENIQLQVSVPRKLSSNQDEITLSEKEATGNKQILIQEVLNNNLNAQDFDRHNKDEQDKSIKQKDIDDYRARNYIQTLKMSRLGFADDELSQSRQNFSSQIKNESSIVNQNDESEYANEQQEQIQISYPNNQSKSNSNITKTKITPGKMTITQFKDDSESQQSKSYSQLHNQNNNSSQQKDLNQLSQLKYTQNQKNETAQKLLTGQKQYQSQQKNQLSSQKPFILDDQSPSEQIQQEILNQKSRISIQVESLEQDEESSRPQSNINSDRRSRKSRQKSRLSHMVDEYQQSQQDVNQQQIQNNNFNECEDQSIEGKQSGKSEKEIKSKQSQQIQKSEISNYQQNIQDNDSDEIQKINSQNIIIEQQSLDQHQEFGQIFIDENQNQEEDENMQNYEQQSGYKIDVDNNFVQNNDYSDDLGVIEGGVDYNLNNKEEESDLSNKQSEFNIQQSESANKSCLIEQNEHSSDQESMHSKYSESKKDESDDQQEDQIADDDHQSENALMEDSSQNQIFSNPKQENALNQNIESQSDNQSDEKIISDDGFDNGYFEEDDVQNEDLIEEDSQQSQTENENENIQQIKQESIEKSEEMKSEHIEIENEDIENSELIQQKSRQSDQKNDLKDAEDEESEEGEYIPGSEEKDSSSNVDTDLVSEEIMVEQINQIQDNDIFANPTSQIDLQNQIDVNQTEVKKEKEKKKKEKIVPQKEISPMKTRNQKGQNKDQSQNKQEIEKFIIQRKPRSAQINEKKEIEKEKSSEKRESLNKTSKIFPQNEQNERKDKKQSKQESLEVEKIEDEINPKVIENAMKRNANRRINLRVKNQSQSSEKHIQKSPQHIKEIKSYPQKENKKQTIKENEFLRPQISQLKKTQNKEKQIKQQSMKEKEIKLSPKKDKEIIKSPKREIETKRSLFKQIQKPIKQNYVDNLEEKQDKAKNNKIDQPKQTNKNREDSLPFSAYQNKEKMIKINKYQVQLNIKQTSDSQIQKQEKQIDNKKHQKLEVKADDKQKRKTLFGLYSQEDDVQMSQRNKNKIQEVQKLKSKLNTEILVRRTQEPRNQSKQIEEKQSIQIQKQISIPPQIKKTSNEELNKKPLGFLGFQSNFQNYSPITKQKTPSPKLKEKKAINFRKSELQPMKTRNSLQSPPIELRNSKYKHQLPQDSIKNQIKQSKAQSPQRNQSNNDSKSKIKKDQVDQPAKKQYSPLKAQEKTKQVIAMREPEKKEFKQKNEKANDQKQKEEQAFTRKRDLKYKEKNLPEIKQLNKSKSISIEKIQLRNIIKPNYAMLSLGLIQKNDIEEKSKQQKTQQIAQNFGLGFFNEDSKNQNVSKIQKQNKEQKHVESQKPVTKISLESFRFDKKQNLKTLIATPSKFKILENKRKIYKYDKSKIKVIQKQDFIIKTRKSLQNTVPEKKDTPKVDQKSKQIKKDKKKIIKKMRILNNLQIINQRIQTRKNLLQKSKVSKQNLIQQKQKKDDKLKNKIPQVISKKQVQEKSSIQNTKVQSPDKKFERKEIQKLGLLVKRPRDDKNQEQRNDQKQKAQRPQFQFIETKKYRQSVEKINKGSLFGFVSK